MQVRLKIEGMHCAGCARAVQNALTAVDQVESAVVDLAAGAAVVTAGGKVDQSALIAALDDAGYEASVEAGQ